MTYKPLAQKQTEDMLEELPRDYTHLSDSVDTLKELRTDRLRAMLYYAKSFSPWYKKQLANLDVEYFTEEDLYKIPTLDKVTLMNNWDEIVTDRRLSLKLVEKHLETINRDENELYLLDRYHTITTSGTSSFRGIFIYDWDEWNRFYIYLIRYGLRYKDRSLILENKETIKIAIVNISNPIFATYSLHKTFIFDDAEKFHLPINLPIAEIVKGLNEAEVDVIIGLPPTIRQLCQEARLNHLHIQPKIIITFGEPLHLPIRHLIQETWPEVSVFNTLSSSEGLIGINCHANSHEIHLNDDGCIVELFDKENKPIGKNRLSSKSYLTNLYNFTLPLIRYELSEQLLFLDKICGCGSNHQLVAEPLYRPEFDFTYRNGILVHHSVFDTPLLLEKNLREYQVLQTQNGVDVKIVTIGEVDKSRLKQRIISELCKIGLSAPTVNIIEIDAFEYPSSGKLRRFLRYTKEESQSFCAS